MNYKYSCPAFQPPNTLYQNVSSPPSIEGIREIPLYIDSKDRDIEKYPDPFSFRVAFNPIGSYTPTPHISEVIRNVKLVKLEYLTLPMTTRYTKIASGIIGMSWKEFNIIYANNDDSVQIKRNNTDNKIVIVANAKDTTTNTFIRKNQILFNMLRINDRIELALTKNDNSTFVLTVNIEQIDNDEDIFYFVSQETYDGSLDNIINVGISKVPYNEQLEQADDAHDKTITIINRNNEINIGKNDTIFLRGKYFYVEKTINTTRLILNQKVNRTFENINASIENNELNQQVVTITSSMPNLYDSENNLKLLPNYLLMVEINGQVFDEMKIISVVNNTITLYNENLQLNDFVENNNSNDIEINLVMWKHLEEINTLTIENADTLVNQRYICMKIKELDTNITSTNQVLNDSFAILNTERYGSGNIIVYPNAEKVFDNQNLTNLTSLTFEFYDENGERIVCSTFDDYFKNKDEYLNQTKLLIHPKNNASQILMSFRVGSLEQNINKKVFC